MSQQRATSLLLLNSYGKEEDEQVVGVTEKEEEEEEEKEEEVTTTATSSSFALVGYEHDDDDEVISNPQANIGRAVINPPRSQDIVTPPSSPPQNPLPNSTTATPDSTTTTITTITTTTTATTATTTTLLSTATSSLRGITLHTSPFRCEALLQPEPETAVAAALQERVVRFFALKSEGKSINDIRHSKQYKNPDILEKLVQHCGINEIGSNYPTELFDPFAFQHSDYYDSIAIEQRRIEEKRPEDRSGARNIEFTHATPATSGKDDKKKSKWDSMDPAAAVVSGGANTVIGAGTGTSNIAKQPQVTVVTGTAPTTGQGPPTGNAYVEYIRDRKKREGIENTKDSNKKAKKYA